MTYRIQDLIGEAIIGYRTRKPNRTRQGTEGNNRFGLGDLRVCPIQ